MPFSKVSERHQITIPKAVFRALNLTPGDVIEIVADKGKAILTPKRMVSSAPAPRLSEEEQKTLASVRKKIEAIQQDLTNSIGLTEAEANVAAKIGVIDPEQKWWWLEDWQKGEREAARDDRQGRFEEFDSPEAFIKALEV